VSNIFTGTQIGEYFGYAVMADDFNDDGLPDLVISAPFHHQTNGYESGAVYVYKNKGNVRSSLIHLKLT
jgi:FG-GAP repeat